MQNISIKQAKTTNLTRYLLFFIVFIGFCTSTLYNTNTNFDERLYYNKTIYEDLNLFKDKKHSNFLVL